MTSGTSEGQSKLNLQPFKGRYDVDIGQSLSRTWSVRTGKPIKRKPQFPDPEFYAMRYKEIPPRLNSSASGTLIPKASNSEGRTYELERPSQTAGTMFTFNAVEQISQNTNTWECLLLYKPDTGSFTLEKLESTLNVSYARQSKNSRPVGSPSVTPPTNSAPSPASLEPHPTKAKKDSGAVSSKKEKPKAKTKSKKKDDFDDLEKMLLRDAEEDGGNDAAEAAEELERMINEETTLEKEEEEDDMVAVDVQPIVSLPVVAASPLKPKATAKAKAATAKEKPKPRPRPTKRKSQQVDEVEIFFGGTGGGSGGSGSGAASNPSPLKKARNDPPPPIIPTPSDILLPPPPVRSPEISYDDSESEASDQDGMLWGEIQDLGGEGHDDAEMDAEEEEDVDDPLFNDLSTPAAAESGRPLTLNEYASEFNGGNDIDEDTSSDDSDDD